tara:strand:+ start:304 stop:1398 length:1095 start_codon:yes stop_codon:yes gene_type:complete
MAMDNNDGTTDILEEGLEVAGTKRKRVDPALTLTVQRRNEEGVPWLTISFQNGEWVYTCSICQETFSRSRVELSRMLKHGRESKRHLNAKSMMKLSTAFMEQETRQGYHEDVGAHILSNNIPLHRFSTLFSSQFISSVVMRKEMTLLSSSSYRDTYCPAAHARWRATLLAKHIEGKPFSLLVDESSKNNRKVVNTIAVTAESNVLIHTKVFDMEESVNGDSVCQYIQAVMKDCALSPSLLVGCTRDNASYMKTAIDKLKTDPLYSHVISVPCLSHGLNLVVKCVLIPFPTIKDKLFHSLKKLFSKPSQRRARAAKRIPGIINAVQVSETRWSGWLESIQFVYENLQEIVVDRIFFPIMFLYFLN